MYALQVMVDVDDKNEWKECIDIGGVRLPTGYFFGASAATGDLSGGSELQSSTTKISTREVFNHNVVELFVFTNIIRFNLA